MAKAIVAKSTRRSSKQRHSRSKPIFTKKEIFDVFTLVEIFGANVAAVESLVKESEDKVAVPKFEAATYLLAMSEDRAEALFHELADRLKVHDELVYKVPDTATAPISPEDLTSFKEAIGPARSLLALTSDHEGSITPCTIHALTFSALHFADEIQSRFAQRLDSKEGGGAE